MFTLGAWPNMTPFRLGLLALAVLVPPTLLAETPLINPFLVAYSLGILLHVVRRQESELDLLQPLFRPAINDVAPFREQLWMHPRALMWATWFIGPAFMLAVNAQSDLAAALLSGERPDTAELWSVTSASLFWVVFLQVMIVLFRNAILFHSLGARHVVIDLFDVGSLTPFARVAARNFLIFMGGLTMAPMQLIQDLSYLPQLSVAMLVSLPFCLVLVTLPIWAIHVRLVESKDEEYARVQRALRGEPGALAGSPIEADADKVTVMNLVLYRDMIRGISEWPLDAPSVLRVATYVIIPLSAWIGAAIVQHWVEALF